MKRIISFMIIAAALLAIAGCASKPAAGADNAAAGSNEVLSTAASNEAGTVQESESAGNSQEASAAANEGSSDTPAVPLVENWPGDVPLIEGTIHISIQNGGTADSGFSTQIITPKNVQEIMDFYMGKFTKVTDEPMKTSDSKETNSCTGIIGGWKVMVTGGEDVRDGQSTGSYVATILVMKNAE